MKKLFILFALFINASLSAQDSLESNDTGRFYVEQVAQSRLTPLHYDKLYLGYLLYLNRMFELRNYTGWDIIVTPASNKPEFAISIKRDSCILVLSEADIKVESEMIGSLVKISEDKLDNKLYKIDYFGLWNIEQFSDSINVFTYRMTIDERESIALNNLFATATCTASYVPTLKNANLTLLPYNTYRICSRDFAGELHTPNYSQATINDNCSRLAKIIDILYEAVRKGDKSLIDNQMKEIISLTEEFKKNDPDIPWERRLTPIQ